MLRISLCFAEEYRPEEGSTFLLCGGYPLPDQVALLFVHDDFAVPVVDV